MASPFIIDDIRTVTLTFETQLSSGTYEDPITGVIVTQSLDVEIECFLKPKRKPVDREIEGVNASSVYMEGYCVDPMILPDTILPGMVAQYAYLDEFSVGHTGEFIFLSTPPSPFPEVREELGDKISGFLNYTSRNEV
jgi:hypothetical protein